MKDFITAVSMGLALASVGLMQGCFMALMAGAVGGAAYGTAKYAGNTLVVDHAGSLDRTWDAAGTALAELRMPAAASKRDAAGGRLEARNAQGQPVIVELRRKSDRVTQIRISVGTFDSTDNRSAAQQVYEKMKAVEEASPPVGKPIATSPP